MSHQVKSGPQGLEEWRVQRSEDRIVVSHPGIGMYAASPDGENIASVILYHLAESILSTPAPAPIAQADEGALEEAWRNRPWQLKPVTDKDKALAWWQAGRASRPPSTTVPEPMLIPEVDETEDSLLRAQFAQGWNACRKAALETASRPSAPVAPKCKTCLDERLTNNPTDGCGPCPDCYDDTPAPQADCPHCGGTGDVSGEYPGLACPACYGTGKAQPQEAK